MKVLFCLSKRRPLILFKILIALLLILPVFQNCEFRQYSVGNSPSTGDNTPNTLNLEVLIKHSDDPIQNQKNIQAAINDINSTNKKITIKFENKIYRVSCSEAPHQYCFNIVNKGNLQLQGDVSTQIIITTPRSGIFHISDSKYITFNNILFDYEIPPFTQGLIKSVNGSHFVFQPSSQYLTPDSDLISKDMYYPAPNNQQTDPSIGIGFIYTSDGQFKVNERDYIPIISHNKLNSTEWQIETGWSNLIQYMAPGDSFAFGPRSSYGFWFVNSENIEVNNIHLYTAPSLAFVFVNGSGYIKINNLNLLRKPNSNRLLSTVGDAIHLQNNLATVLITNSYIAHTGDDALNTYSTGDAVIKNDFQSLNQILISTPLSPKSVLIGQQLQFISPDKKIIYFKDGEEPTINNIQKTSDGYLLTMNQNMNHVPIGTLSFNKYLAGTSVALKNNRFGPFRGFLRLRSKSTYVENNIFEKIENAKILYSAVKDWNEGPITAPPQLSNNKTPSMNPIELLGLDYTVSKKPSYYTDPKILEEAIDNHSPLGTVDIATDLTFEGWAFDLDSKSESIEIAVYVDAAPGQPGAQLIHLQKTSLLRSDVNTSYSVTGNHGFQIKLNEIFRNRRLFFYALNTGITNSASLIFSN